MHYKGGATHVYIRVLKGYLIECINKGGATHVYVYTST